MKKKTYTVADIDNLRRACEDRYLYRTSYFPPVEAGKSMGYHSRSYKEDEKYRCVEEMVRTFLSAGITADQIIEEDKKKYDKRRQLYK